MFSKKNKANQEPIIVQGTVVPQQQQQQQIQYEQQSTGAYVAPVLHGDSDGEFKGKGELQAPQFRDKFFAIAFVLHLLFMLGLAVVMGAPNGANEYNANGEVKGEEDYSGVLYLVFICGIFSIGLSGFSLGWMMRNSTTLVKTALIFSVGTSLAIGMLGLMFGNMLMGIMGLLSFGIGCCYAYFVWQRIPFAASNLNTALTAVRANSGLTVTAFGFLGLALLWSLWWSVAAGGALANMGEGSLFLSFVSYFWTHQVLQNTLICITSGVIGTWWFAPSEANSWFSQALKDSSVRALTYSFGSICFGSLIVAVVQALRQLNHYARSQGEDGAILVCVIDCILGCIENIIEYLNKWAYVYVGLYGYPYLEAGKNVLTLFRSKGWTAIITDDLVDNVLFMVSVGIGLISGFVALTLAEIDQNLLAGIGYEGSGMAAFFIGFLVGLVISSVLLGVVGSAVNTVIVLFAEAPNEFQHNHAELSQEMRQSWAAAWPDECRGMGDGVYA